MTVFRTQDRGHPGDGVVVIPWRDAHAAAVALDRTRHYEQERMGQIARGDHIPAWVDRLLSERGAHIRDESLSS